MERRELGRSGVAVTRVILGCGNFGGVGSAPAFWGQGIAKDDAFALMDTAWDLGLTTFDTADAYGGGRSEAWIGEWLSQKGPAVRDALVLQTKTFNPTPPHDDRGLRRSRILRQVDVSLERLGVARLPVYLAHAFDPDVPQEETLRGFDQVVREGKAVAVGASNFTAEQLAEAVEISELEELARYECVQNAYSLLEQGDAETVFPVCREQGLAYQVHSPLAGGWLAGRYRRGEPFPEGSRMTQRPEPYVQFVADEVFDVLEAFEREAGERGVSMAALALAWLLASDDVAAIVIGPTKVEHLEPVREALALELTPDESEHLRGLFA
jgi:1-deoxyxylulose-5-phosphate synthase